MKPSEFDLVRAQLQAKTNNLVEYLINSVFEDDAIAELVNDLQNTVSTVSSYQNPLNNVAAPIFMDD